MKRLSVTLLLWLCFGCFFAKINRNIIERVEDVYSIKMSLLSNLSPKPRRILISGGSNAFWGLHSERMRELTKRPVFNLALESEAFDPALMKILTLKEVRPGDTVVYSSVSFWIPKFYGIVNALALSRRLGIDEYDSDRKPPLWQVQEWWRPTPYATSAVDLGIRYFSKNEGRQAKGEHVDELGDFVGCLSKKPAVPLEISRSGENTEFMEAIRPFKKEVEARGGTLVTVAPWILVRSEDIEKWNAHYVKMMQELDPAQIEHTNSPSSPLRTSPAEFCNGPSHLTRKMGAKRVESQILPKLVSARVVSDQG